MLGKKTGGRIKGISFNKPKVTTLVPTPVAAARAAARAAAAPLVPPVSARTYAREAPSSRPAKRANLLNASLTVETWPITRLREYERNPRNNDGAVGRMVDQIKEFGFRIPIVARSDGTLVDGHLRLKAARKLKLAEVPVALADELTETQIKAFRLSVNKSAEWATWNPTKLRLEIKDLKLTGFDLDLTGFDDGELAELGDAPLPRLASSRPAKKTATCPECGHAFSP